MSHLYKTPLTYIMAVTSKNTYKDILAVYSIRELGPVDKIPSQIVFNMF